MEPELDLSAVCSWMGLPKCILNPSLHSASAIASLSFPAVLKGDSSCPVDGHDSCWRGLLPYRSLSLQESIDHLHENPAIAQNNHQGNLLRFLVYALCHFRALTELQKPPYTSVEDPVHLVILAWKYAKFVLFNDALDMLSYRRDGQYKAIKRQQELGQRAGWTTMDVPFAKFNRRLFWVTPIQLEHWAASCICNDIEHLEKFMSCWAKVWGALPSPQVFSSKPFLAKRRMRGAAANRTRERELELQTTVRLAEIAAAMHKTQMEEETKRQQIQADLEKARLAAAAQ